MSNVSDDNPYKYAKDLENLFDDEKNINTIIGEYLIDYISTVVDPLFKSSSDLDAKRMRGLSQPAHIITSVFTGAILYLYDRASTKQNSIQTHDIKLLCTALTLHDINKYWNETTDSRYEGNYRKLVESYFETDKFNLKAYFPYWHEELEEITFLVQHAQERDDAQWETKFSRPKYGKLLPYVKIGDKVASLSKLDYPLQEIQRKLEIEGHDVHLLLLPEISQQLLSQVIYRSAKRLLYESGGVPLLISTQGILYLSIDKIVINTSKLKDIITKELVAKTRAQPKLNYKTCDLTPLLSVPLSKEERFSVYVESVKEITENGLLGVLGKTTYPPEDEFQESLACFTYFVYNDKKNADWNNFPELESLIKDNKHLDELQKFGNMRANFADQDGIGTQKCKAYLIHELVKNQNNYRNIMNSLHDLLVTSILSKLEDKSNNLVDFMVEQVRAFNEDISLILENIVYPNGNTNVCFKCGSIAEDFYKPSNHFISTRCFSKKVTISDKYKRECIICKIEHILINKLIENSGLNNTDDLVFFYFYFDTIFINVDPFQEQMSKVEISVHGTEKLGINFSLGDFGAPFYIVPMAIKLPPGKSDLSAKTTRRARAIHTAIKACLECGCKCVVTRPYTLMRTYNEVFFNEQPSTLEMNFGLDKIFYFEDAKNINAQLDFINQFDNLKGLHRVERFEPITVIPYAKHSIEKKSMDFNSWLRKKKDSDNIDNGDTIEKLLGGGDRYMKEIAKKGLALFGKHKFGGSYKRVKIFRTTLDSLMASRAQNYSKDEAICFAAAEVWKDVLREQFSKKAGKDIPDDSMRFVESVVEYLEDHNLWDIKKMSQWENALANVYEFEYIQNLKGENQ
jgi:CRISPR-associated protein Csc3